MPTWTPNKPLPLWPDGFLGGGRKQGTDLSNLDATTFRGAQKTMCPGSGSERIETNSKNEMGLDFCKIEAGAPMSQGPCGCVCIYIYIYVYIPFPGPTCLEDSLLLHGFLPFPALSGKQQKQVYLQGHFGCFRHNSNCQSVSIEGLI